MAVADSEDRAAETLPGASEPQAAPPAARRPLWMWIVIAVLAGIVLYAALPRVLVAAKTVSTDDAYVNGHVTFVAPRVSGMVKHVLVDDNNRVHKGDILVQ